MRIRLTALTPQGKDILVKVREETDSKYTTLVSESPYCYDMAMDLKQRTILAGMSKQVIELGIRAKMSAKGAKDEDYTVGVRA